MVTTAQLMIGMAGAVFPPAIAAIALGLVGPRGYTYLAFLTLAGITLLALLLLFGVPETAAASPVRRTTVSGRA